MDGIGMMLKAFGLDPDEMKQTAEKWMQSAKSTCDYFAKRHDATDATLRRIEAKVDFLLSEKIQDAANTSLDPSTFRNYADETGEANGKPN